jgi:hypothetical protein
MPESGAPPCRVVHRHGGRLRTTAVLLALTAVAAAAGCAGRGPPPADRPPAGRAPSTPASGDGDQGDLPAKAQAIRLEGVLTGEGVECQALRTSAGELYTLTGDLGGLGIGDRVRLQGRVARFSTCMQGTTVTVESIERID